MQILDLSHLELIHDSMEVLGAVGISDSLSSLWHQLFDYVPQGVTVEKLDQWSSENSYGETYSLKASSNQGSFSGLLSFLSLSS